jgi:hypothetical protein
VELLGESVLPQLRDVTSVAASAVS